MPIRILPQEVASAIAAGEVVERPASVVKELIENSLDAGATRVEVVVERGGRGLIEVSDNGCGIPAEEVPLAVERYATSKLQTADDLFSLRTLGFRGEALSSIAAVSRMELVTRTAEEAQGRRLVVEGAKVQALKSVGAPPGTLVRVRDLFFNVPARQKFLKTEATERRNITEVVTRFALAYPKVSFRLVQEGREVLHSTGSGDRREALAAVFGPEIARQLIAIPESQGGPVRVSGYISPPSVNRATRRGLIFFVNGRLVRDARLSAAVVQAYHTLIMVGRYPMAVLLLEMAPENVDVNVHPTKAEIRFRDPRLVFSVVQRAVRATLIGQAPPSVALESVWGAAPAEAGDPSVSPDWHLAGVGLGSTEDHRIPPSQIRLPVGEMPLLRAVGQVGATYLVAEGPDGLYLIDQHAAHERVLYEKLMTAWKEGSLESQNLLEPLTLELPPAQSSQLEEQLTTLQNLGFDVESFGRHVFRLRAIPSLLSKVSPEQTLRVVVESFEEDETPLEAEAEARIVARVCKRAAVKAGQVLSLVEQQELLRDLEACEAPRTCPHGRPTMIHLSVETLAQQFGRRG
ncbi:MAG: DNA mismatch repair endonuclease MutL [Anaerolineales bacterium]